MRISLLAMLIINECLPARLAQPDFFLQLGNLVGIAHIARAVILRAVVQTEVVQKLMYHHLIEH